ncbi:MAG: restriction endonuclease [Clostridia bacterium]|nr:restriction endonuclease [Clostridia bacterium]
MARTAKKQETPVAATRAEKKDAVKNIIRELLAVKPHKHNELIEEAAKVYAERFGEENVNDVNGRIGSVLDIMKKESDVMYDGGMYALKARIMPPPPVKENVENTVTTEEKPAKKTRAKTKKTAEIVEEKTEEKPVKKTAKKVKAEEAAKEEVKAEKSEEKPTKKTRTRTKKEVETVAVAEEKEEAKAEEIKPQEKQEEKQEKREEKKNLPVVKEKAEVAEKDVVMDMSFLFGDVKAAKPAPAPVSVPAKAENSPVEAKPTEKSAEIAEEEKNAPAVKTERKPMEKAAVKPAARILKTVKRVQAQEKPMTADEKLRENFLKKLRSLGGDYFEYYSVYLLERYSLKNGRRLEGLKISGGEHDGGIDGEIELTDKLGFKETIYIQAKNWNPEKGDERLWVVGETLLQQFIGACACRQAKDKKQHCRGIFITTSRFTPEAKRILNDMSDKIVGYDGEDLYEAAKECKFGLLYENGNWKLDEKLLSGTKAFFSLYG